MVSYNPECRWCVPKYRWWHITYTLD